MKWFSINHVDGVALVSINGDIGGFGIGADDFERELGDCQTVELFIDSFGGDSLCAMKVYDLLRPRNVSALVTGECFSAAVTIFLAASRRSMLPKAEIMVHQPVNFVCGSSAFLRQSADGLDRLTARIKQAYCEATGQPAETIDRWFNGADFHFDPAKAISDGLAHEVVNQTQRALPAPAQGFDAPGSQTRQPTADESFFYDLLAGLGRINVSDKDKFAARLGGWLNTSVGQRDKTL